MISETSVFEGQGRVWVRNALSGSVLRALDSTCDVQNSPGERLEWNSRLGEVIGRTSRLTQLARRFLPQAVPVRIVVFNKSSGLNWSVPWHQDRVIAVRERHETDGYTAWTRKAGQWHVEPPLALLESMLFARVHLDDTDLSNGCLELALGSHRLGRVSADDAARVAERQVVEPCCAVRGDVLFVKALTLHRSGSSRVQSGRRTLRIDYAAASLPEPLRWAL